MENYLGITINNDLDKEFSDQAISLLRKYYLRENEAPQKAFARVSLTYSKGVLEFAQRIYDYASTRKFMFSSPILSNAPLPGEKLRSQPVSCFVSHVPDKINHSIDHLTSVCWYTIVGGGVGADWREVRTADSQSSGPVSFLTPINSIMTSFKQSKTRKGSYTAYLDVNHPEILEFISVQIPTGGDINRKNFNLFNAGNITDEFMLAVKNGDTYSLVDPKTNKKNSYERDKNMGNDIRI